MLYIIIICGTFVFVLSQHSSQLFTKLCHFICSRSEICILTSVNWVSIFPLLLLWMNWSPSAMFSRASNPINLRKMNIVSNNVIFFTWNLLLKEIMTKCRKWHSHSITFWLCNLHIRCIKTWLYIQTSFQL